MAETSAPSGECVVFVGPCLAGLTVGQKARLLEGSVVRPPVARGDVLGALCRRPRTLVILDGYYYTRPAIPHKELLYALESGVQVFGGASMGALRAAELSAFGMQGVGRIFEDYQQGVLDGDDEVAILHSTEDDGYRALTVASVEVRHALERLQARSHVDASSATQLIDGLRRVGFLDRTPELLHSLCEDFLSADASHRLQRMLERSSLKRRDAVLTLAAARRAGTPAPRTSPSQRRASTLYFDYFRLWGLSHPAEESLSELTLHRAAYLACVLHPRAGHYVEAWRNGFLLAWLMQEAGEDLSDGDLNQKMGHLRQDHPDACRVLPELEVEAMARQRLLEGRALQRHGTVQEAWQALAPQGIPDPNGDDVGCFDLQRIIPPWPLVRAFAFSPLLAPALELAAQVFPLARRFATWAGASKVGRRQLVVEAARLWACETDQVDAEALRRGLLPGDGFAEGLWEVLQAVVIAERIKPPLAAYQASKANLEAVAH